MKGGETGKEAPEIRKITSMLIVTVSKRNSTVMKERTRESRGNNLASTGEGEGKVTEAGRTTDSHPPSSTTNRGVAKGGEGKRNNAIREGSRKKGNKSEWGKARTRPHSNVANPKCRSECRAVV